MTQEITNPSDIDFNQLTFSDKNTAPTGASFVNVSYKGGRLYLQVPKLKIFGLNKQFDDSDQKKWESTLQWNQEDIDNDDKIKKAYEGLRDFEKHVKKWAKENSQDLFKKKKMSDEVIDTIFNDYFKPSKNKETQEEDGRAFYQRYKYTIKKDDTVFEVGVFDKNKKEVVLTLDNISDVIRMYSSVKCIITPNIYISSGKFGVTWKVWQMKIWEPEGVNVQLNRRSYAMVDSSSEDEDDKNEDENDKNENDENDKNEEDEEDDDSD